MNPRQILAAAQEAFAAAGVARARLAAAPVRAARFVELASLGALADWVEAQR